MLKSYEDSLLLVLRGILTDAARAYPADSDDFGRDFSRILRNVEARGLSVLTLELPALCKHLDRCLDNALWVEPCLPLSRRRGPHSTIPRLFARLWNRVFNDIGCFVDVVDIQAISFLRQLLLFAKKVKLECSPERTLTSIRDFYAIEDKMASPDLDWNGDTFSGGAAKFLNLADPVGFYPIRGELPLESRVEPIRTSLLKCIQQVADILSCVIGDFDPFDHAPKHGPGVVSDLKGGEFKYSFPSWPDRLETIFPYADFAFANYATWTDSLPAVEHYGSDPECSSRLIVVPKTQKAPRLIAAEPVAHQWCQQVIWSFFKARYASTFLDRFVSFGDQTGNQDLARLASKESSHWTIDLSSASDRLSCRVVERIFRRIPSLLDALYASRTRYLSQNLDDRSPRIVRLKKFSTMGSACTFPVQSHVFLAIALGSTLYGKGSAVTLKTIMGLAGQVRVFGDDIIVPKDGGRHTVEALGYLGLKVNQEKTYRNGRFRESCGLEAFDGIEISPAYFLRPPSETSPESIVSAVASSNNFFLKGFWNAASAIEQTMPRGITLPVVGIFSGFVGYSSFCGSDIRPLRRRWNKDLHREEVLVSKAVTAVEKQDVSHWGQLLQYFTERPEPDLFWSSGVVGRPRSKLRRGWVSATELGGLTP